MQPSSWSRTAWETLQTVVVALVLALLIRHFVVESFVVQGSSMEPTLHSGERVLVNKFVYRVRPPADGDIIVFRPPKTEADKDYIKRIIATGGQQVRIVQGVVWVDGHRLAEPYLPRAYQGDGSFPPFQVPPGEVFVLGDNRNNSEDSRYFGPVPVSSIRGEAMVVWWPPADVRSLR